MFEVRGGFIVQGFKLLALETFLNKFCYLELYDLDF